MSIFHSQTSGRRFVPLVVFAAFAASASGQSTFAFSDVTSHHAASDSFDRAYDRTLYCGTNFIVDQDRRVTALATYDDLGNGLAGDVYVGLYEVTATGNTLISHGTVAGGTSAPLEGIQRLTQGLTEDVAGGLMLHSGSRYAVLSLVPAQEAVWASNIGGEDYASIEAPWIQFGSVHGSFAYSPTPSDGFNLGDPYAYFGGNLKTEAVPEPSAFGVLGLGALVVWHRRRRS